MCLINDLQEYRIADECHGINTADLTYALYMGIFCPYMNSTSDRQLTITVCRRLLEPVASFLLKCGMTWREFSAVSKAVFVEVASRDYGIGGRLTNISRVSILTGIGRKEVKRLRESDDTATPAKLADKSTDATRLLAGWHQDPDFIDESGGPRALDQTGALSFTTLCERYAGDVPVSAMLKELKRVGAVEENDGQLRAVSRYYMPVRTDAQWLLSAGSAFHDFGNNLNHNLGAKDRASTLFLGRATNADIPKSAEPAFHAFLEEQGQSFLERVDDWLTTHAAAPDTDTDRVRLGVGLFAIEGGDSDKQVKHND